MLAFAFLSVLLAASQAWHLNTNVDDVTPGVSRDVKLTCQPYPEKGEMQQTLKKITRLRIVKEQPFNAKIVLATFVLDRDTTSKLDESIEAKSDNTDLKTSPSLEITWPTATKDTAGVYGCEVIDFDVNEKFVSHIVASAAIKEETGTMTKVDERIQSKVGDLRDELNSLRNDLKNQEDNHIAEITNLSNQLNAMRKELKAEKANYKAELSTYKQNFEANYVTKANLAKTVSAMKTFTSNEIKNSDIVDQTKHRDIERQIQETESSCNTNYSKLESASHDMNKSLSTQIEDLTRGIQDNSKKIKDGFINTTNRIAALVDSKCQRVMDTLRDDVTKEIRKCGCDGGSDSNQLNSTTTTTIQRTITTTATTTTTTKPHTTIYWPQGQYYALPSYNHLGCPTANPFPHSSTCSSITGTGSYDENLFKAESFDYFREDRGDPSTSNIPDELWEFVVNGRVEKAQICRKRLTTSLPPPTPTTTNNEQWPEGKYCINLINDRHVICPSPLKLGSILYFHGRVRYAVSFCCATSGDATLPIRLPVEKPFMLYRLGGWCQKVKDMSVSQMVLSIKPIGEGAPPFHIKYAPDGMYQLRKLFVCHYTPQI